jgi:polysaccharide pyruvyl transferase WcaK-like protein
VQNSHVNDHRCVGIFGTPGSVLLAELGSEAAMHKVGMNTGNLLFQYACTKFIVNPVVHVEFGLDLAIAKELIDVLMIPAANQLNPQWDLKWWAKLVEDLDKPVVIVGLGTQAKIDEVESVELRPGTVRFLHAVRERAKVIGVRGTATLAVMERYGVDNAVITGCPSNFINPRITGAGIQSKLDLVNSKDALSVNYLVGTLEDYALECERKLFSLVYQHQGRFVYQTNHRLLTYILDGHEDEELRQYLDWEAKRIAPELDPSVYRENIRRRGRYFFSAPGWIDDVSRDDLSVGMRIHGAVAAVQGGSVGICVAFDSRTLELAQTMGYPYVSAKKIQHYESLVELANHTIFDPEDFDRKRLNLRANTKLCIEQHGVMTNLDWRD